MKQLQVGVLPGTTFTKTISSVMDVELVPISLECRVIAEPPPLITLEAAREMLLNGQAICARR
jgi:hypothetical protein